MSTITKLTYGSDPRQYSAIWTPKGSQAPSHWVIFMHGGAWVDYQQTEKDGDALLKAVVKDNVWGASIEYRLAPEVSGKTFAEDVYSAVKSIFDKYPSAPWTMIGHSAGAFHSLKLDSEVQAKGEFASPTNIILSEGIYDLRTLVDDHPSYSYFTDPSWGVDRSMWDEESPLIHHKASPKIKYTIVHSDIDELVPFDGQPQLLAKKWKEQGVPFEFEVIRGLKHDDVFISSEFASIVKDIVQKS
ncbi:Kynurenine formamidase [Yarrowia sp. E02]|nr:Kynurenine formamidase [Yarrowia sp. E02]